MLLLRSDWRQELDSEFAFQIHVGHEPLRTTRLMVQCIVPGSTLPGDSAPASWRRSDGFHLLLPRQRSLGQARDDILQMTTRVPVGGPLSLCRRAATPQSRDVLMHQIVIFQ
jgi:hypothetical protein